MIISVINLKGGSGKTTTAMALATAAARHNRNHMGGRRRRRRRNPAVHRGLRQYRQTETTAQNHGG